MRGSVLPATVGPWFQPYSCAAPKSLVSIPFPPPMPDYTLRHATIADLRSNLHLWEPDRSLFTPAIWTRLADLLEPLLATQRVRIGLVEERETGRARLLGGCCFVEPALMREAIATEESTLINALFTMVAEGRSPFLSLKQTAVANAAGELIAFSFLGVPDLDYSAEPMSVEDGLLAAVVFQSYGFFHAGYQKMEGWGETLRPAVRQIFARIGAPTEVRERTAHNGPPAWLFRQTLAEAQANPGAAFVYQFLARPPRLDDAYAKRH